MAGAPDLYLHGLVLVLQALSAILPAFFAGTIFGYNYIMIPPILRHSGERALAKQWLEAYQFGARYVRPLVFTTTMSNLLLVYLAATSAPDPEESLTSQDLHGLQGRPALLGYVATALCLPAVLFYTLVIMEPGINGGLKHKVKMLAGNEVHLKKDNIPIGEHRDTASPAEKKRAESESLRSLVMEWKRCNDGRMILALLGAATSLYTSLELAHS